MIAKRVDEVAEIEAFWALWRQLENAANSIRRFLPKILTEKDRRG
jgi:hypothetical protein